MLEGLVLRSISGFYRVRTDEGVLECRMRGRLKKERAKSELAVVGDRVKVERQSATEGVIAEVEPRRTRFSRREPGPRGQYFEDVLVANLDRLLIAASASVPPLRPRMVDRFLVIAEWNDVEPIVVITKLDACEDREALERTVEMWRRVGYRVVLTSATSGEGVAEVRALIEEGISAIVGPSGSGKSSLLNAIAPSLAIAVGDVSDAMKRGKHTTRTAELHPVPSTREGAVGWVADTPGIRELASFHIPERDLGPCFPELRPYLRECQFADCLHDGAPGCAVRPAVERGEIAPERFDSYLRQLRGEDAAR